MAGGPVENVGSVAADIDPRDLRVRELEARLSSAQAARDELRGALEPRKGEPKDDDITEYIRRIEAGGNARDRFTMAECIALELARTLQRARAALTAIKHPPEPGAPA